MCSYRERCISEDSLVKSLWITARENARTARDLLICRLNYNWSDWRTTWP